MRRLYFRIYLAVLGSLALFAVLVGLTGWIFREFREPDGGRPEIPFVSDVAEHLLPSAASPAALSQELQFWHDRTKFDLALLSPAGKVIAQAGAVPKSSLAALTHSRFRRFHQYVRHGAFAVRLNDGRQLLVVRPSLKPGFPPPLRWLGIVFAIGLAVAVSAYPVIRRLTKNLEQLQRGVAAFGQGNLTARVAARGHDEVGKLAETFNATADRIEALVKAQKTLLAHASHELRSPLARLRMAAEAISTSAPSQEKEEIARNIAELDGLVDEILLASRLEADAGAATGRQKIDLIGLLAEECAPFGVDLDAVPGQPVLIEGDARLIRRLFRNLLENARRHGGQGPIEVTVASVASVANVTVCDRGPGIPDSERGRVFEPFYRLKGHPEGNGGIGLGLSLVRQIAERHRGEVQYVPREGTGACFQVTLPLRGSGGGESVS
ncbi:MAG: sensor histidine kinase [Rhodomicrobium sp.]